MHFSLPHISRVNDIEIVVISVDIEQKCDEGLKYKLCKEQANESFQKLTAQNWSFALPKRWGGNENWTYFVLFNSAIKSE